MRRVDWTQPGSSEVMSGKRVFLLTSYIAKAGYLFSRRIMIFFLFLSESG